MSNVIKKFQQLCYLRNKLSQQVRSLYELKISINSCSDNYGAENHTEDKNIENFFLSTIFFEVYCFIFHLV